MSTLNQLSTLSQTMECIKPRLIPIFPQISAFLSSSLICLKVLEPTLQPRLQNEHLMDTKIEASRRTRALIGWSDQPKITLSRLLQQWSKCTPVAVLLQDRPSLLFVVPDVDLQSTCIRHRWLRIRTSLNASVKRYRIQKTVLSWLSQPIVGTAVIDQVILNIAEVEVSQLIQLDQTSSISSRP